MENAVSGVRKVKEFSSANISGLPTGTLPGGGFYDIQPDDVTMMTASYGALTIVAKVGSEQYAWLFTSRLNADGWLGAGRNKWELVQTKEGESDPVPLSDVKAMRVQNGDTASSGAVMVHAGDKVYAFGNSVYLGGEGNKTTLAYAAEMKLDALNGEIPKIIGVTGNGTGNSFFILTEAGTLWSVGDNSQFQLGQSSALSELKEWGKVRIYGYTSGAVNEADNLVGKVKHFSVQEHEKGGTGTSWGASGLLIADISAYAEHLDGEEYEGGSAQVFTWGTNNGQMIGRDGTHNLTSLDEKSTPAFWGHHGADSAASVTNGANAEGYYHVGIPLEYKDSVDLTSGPPVAGGIPQGIGDKQAFLVPAKWVEAGGHTGVILPAESPRFCYVGHRIAGSMGHGLAHDDRPAAYTCTATPVLNICGAAGFDYGDAPRFYDDGGGSNLPMHFYAVTKDSLYLGSKPPQENDETPKNVIIGTSNVGNRGDYNGTTYEEDGVGTDGGTGLTVDLGATTFSLPVTVFNNTGGAAYLHAWIDWDNDGKFSTDEYQAATVSAGASSPVTLTWNGLGNGKTDVVGQRYVRLRLTTDTLPASNVTASTGVDSRSLGFASDGEIEDHSVWVQDPANTAVNVPPIAIDVTSAPVNINNEWQLLVLPGNSGAAKLQGADQDGTVVSYIVQQPSDGELQYQNHMGNWVAVTANTEIEADWLLRYRSSDPAEATFSFQAIDNYGASSVDHAPVGATCADSGGIFSCSSATAPGQGVYTIPKARIDAVNDGPIDTGKGVATTTQVLGNDIAGLYDGGSLVDQKDAVSVKAVGEPRDSSGNDVGTVVCSSDAGGPEHGKCTFTPSNNSFTGTVSYQYQICLPSPNAHLCDTATVTLNVKDVAIDAVDDDVTTPVNVPVTIDVKNNDTVIGGTIGSSVTPNNPSNGTVDCTSGQCVFTPTSNFVGTGGFDYTICETTNTTVCDTAHVTVEIKPTITTTLDTATTPPGASVIINVLGNDSKTPDSVAWGSLAKETDPSNGSVVCDLATGCTYTPTAGYIGSDTFTYKVCLAAPWAAVCKVETVNVTISNPPVIANPSITANDDLTTTPANTPVTTSVITNDRVVDGSINPDSVAVITPPTNGTVVCTAGSCTYTPAPGFTGEDEYTYQVCMRSPASRCDTATVNVTVTPPEVAPDVYTMITMAASSAPDKEISALIHFGNQGEVEAENVSYQLSGLPVGLSGVSCEGAACSYDAATGVVTISGLPTVLAAGQEHALMLKWTPPAEPENARYTLRSEVRTTSAGDPQPNNIAEASVQLAVDGEQAEVTTTVSAPASVAEGKEISAKVSYVNIGSESATDMEYRVEVDNGSDVLVRYQGQECVRDQDGLLSGCGLPASLEPGERIELEVSYIAPAAGETVSITTRVDAVNDGEEDNNVDQASTLVKAADEVGPDVTTTVAPPALAIAGETVRVPVTFSNIGEETAEDVRYQFRLEKGLNGVNCEQADCVYDPATGMITLNGLPDSLEPGEQVSVVVSYTAPSAKDVPNGEVGVYSRIDAVNEDEEDEGNNEARAVTRIINPGVIDIVKTVYEGHDGGASCSNPAVARKELLIVEKDPTSHKLTWCFTVTNTGSEYLGAPVWADSAYPGMAAIRLTPVSLPLAPGATGVWYFEAEHDRSVRNVVSIEMPVTDPAGNLIPEAPPAFNSDEGEAIFGMIYDPPFGVKVGQQEGFDIINWTMVWVNDNLIAANNVRVFDAIKAPMDYAGSLSCVGEGLTTVLSCDYDAASKTVSARANFGADFGKTVVNAQNRLFISFKVKVPVDVEQVENQAEAAWTPTDTDGKVIGEEMESKTDFVSGLEISVIDPLNPQVPVVRPPVGVDPTDPNGPLGHPDPGAVESPAGTEVDLRPPTQSVTPVPVDNPLALLLLAIGVAGVAARYQRRR